MKIAAIQMVSGPSVQRNLDTAGQWLAQAAAQGAELAVLPEYFCVMGEVLDEHLQDVRRRLPAVNPCVL